MPLYSWATGMYVYGHKARLACMIITCTPSPFIAQLVWTSRPRGGMWPTCGKTDQTTSHTRFPAGFMPPIDLAQWLPCTMYYILKANSYHIMPCMKNHQEVHFDKFI